MFDVDSSEGKLFINFELFDDIRNLGNLSVLRLNHFLMDTLCINNLDRTDKGRGLWHVRIESDGFEEIERIFLTDTCMI